MPVAYDGHAVDLEVRTRDVWTLNPGVSFSRKGGENAFGAQIQEDNLLGSGQSIGIEWDDNVDREIACGELTSIRTSCTASRSSALAYADADDGTTKLLQLSRPFYALDVRRAGGVYLCSTTSATTRATRSARTSASSSTATSSTRSTAAGRAGCRGAGCDAGRPGATYERDQFAPDPDEPLGGPLPEDRELVYPWVGFELVEDSFQERVNQDQIRRTEDVLVGLRASARLGYAAEASARTATP